MAEPAKQPDTVATIDAIQRVAKALQNPKWEWRTLAGIAEEAGLSNEQTIRVLDSIRRTIEEGKTSANVVVYRLRPLNLVEGESDRAFFWNYLTKSSRSTGIS